MQSRWKRWSLGLASLLGMLLWLNVPVARANNPYTALRFFDNKSSMIVHVNDLQATADDLMALAGRYGMDVTANGLLQMGRMQMMQMLRLSSIPKDWSETFSAVGLPTHPSATIYLGDMYSNTMPDFLAVIPLKDTGVVLKLLKNTLPNYFAMQEYRTCRRICRSYRQAAQLYQVRYGRAPKSLDELRGSGMLRSHKACREVPNFTLQGGAVSCGGLGNPRVWMQQAREIPPMSVYKDAQVVRMGKVGLALHKAGFALIATRPQSLKAALDRFDAQAKHPKQDAFAKQQDSKTRFQFLMDYQVMMKDSLKQQQEQMRQLQGMPFIDFFKKLQDASKKYIKAYGDTWMLGLVDGDRYKFDISIELRGKDLPLIQAMHKLPLVSAMQVYKMIPRDVVMAGSANFVQMYGEFAEEIASALGDDLLKSLGPVPAKSSIKAWFATLGQEVGFSLGASGQKLAQGALYLELKDPKAFDAKLMPLLGKLEAEVAKNKMTQLSKVQLPGAVVYRATIRASARISIDIAFARFGSFFVVTAEPTAGVALRTMRQILDTLRGKAPSLLQSPTFAKALQQTPPNNGVMFMDMDLLAAKVRRYAPPVPALQVFFTVMGPLSHAWAWTRMRPVNDISFFYSYLQFKSNKATPTGSAPQGTVEDPAARGAEMKKQEAPTSKPTTPTPATSQPTKK
ncbi:MAG: hypothetical protein H6728_01030 [Myxococcales bacterium]|nr:hypothetical protein [Myxococcales bacterium]